MKDTATIYDLLKKSGLSYYLKEERQVQLHPEQILGRAFLRELSMFVFDRINAGKLVDEKIELDAVNRELNAYGITDAIYDSETAMLLVHTSSPGILIGVRGENIQAIDTALKTWAKGRGIPFEGICIREDMYPLINDLTWSVNSYLIATDDSDLGDW